VKKWILKDRLKNAFRTGGLCQQTERNGRTLKKYPSIVDVRIKEDKTVYVFRIPPGLNPAELKKKEYVFHSYFGHNVDFKGDKGVYILTVFNNVMDQSFVYDFEKLEIGRAKLPVLIGNDIHGKTHFFDMVKNPHLLIAGETGSGKSVMLRSIITTLILHKRTGLELYLADLKRSEFHVFRHVDIVKAVMTKKTEVLKCLHYLQKEMSLRGDLLDSHEVEHIDEYNKTDVTKKPYILLCIDEYAQLKKETDITEIVDEIGRIGRALGIFLILSMQRPDADVLKGGLKSNLTVRYGFRHADKINSDITLGRGMKEDCSKIDKTSPGKFYFSNGEVTLMQAPLLEMEDAKTLLEPFKERKNAPNGRETILDVEYREEDATSEDFAPLVMLEEGEHERTRQGDN
jgi:DNA segregation ATPase FtsK/SpoIIIE, S-DNA-T family